MTFDQHLAKQISDLAAARKRIGQQAADRAEANGFDPEAARIFATQLFRADCSHEEIIKAVSGEYQRRVA